MKMTIEKLICGLIFAMGFVFLIPNSVNAETQKQFSFGISGTSTEDADTYVVSIGTQGLNINSDDNAVRWSDIKDSSNNAADLSNVKAGTYYFSYKGVQISFTIDEDITMDQFKDGLDGLSWSTKDASGRRQYEFYGIMDHLEDKDSLNVKYSPFWNGRVLQDAVRIDSDVISGYHIYYSDLKNSQGKSITEEVSPGEYKGGIRKPQYAGMSNYGYYKIAIVVGEDNTASFEEIRDNLMGRFFTYTSSTGYTVLLSSEDVTYTSVTADRVINIPTYVSQSSGSSDSGSGGNNSGGGNGSGTRPLPNTAAGDSRDIFMIIFLISLISSITAYCFRRKYH